MSVRQDYMSLSGNIPFQIELPTFDLISELTHFNLSFRLSKVKQLAFFLVSLVGRTVEQSAAVQGNHLFVLSSVVG